MWMFGSRTTVKKVRNLLTWFSHDVMCDDWLLMADDIWLFFWGMTDDYLCYNAAMLGCFFVCLVFSMAFLCMFLLHFNDEHHHRR